MSSAIDEADEKTFTKVQYTMSKKGKKSTSTALSVEEKYQAYLKEYLTVIDQSALFKELKLNLDTQSSITHIRCLALGNFIEDDPARYQFALLLQMIDYLKSKSDNELFHISLYDPIFTDLEIQDILQRNKNIENNECWSIDENDIWEEVDSAHILWFLPHADLDLTENVVKNNCPRLLLSNHVLQHTDRFTKQSLFNQFPYLSKMVHSIDKGTSCPIEDGFQIKTKKKRKPRNGHFKGVSEAKSQAHIDYSTIDSTFEKCEIISNFGNGSLLRDQPWQNAFSDLALHFIT